MWLEVAVVLVSLWVVRMVHRLLVVKDLKGQVALVTGGGSGIGRKMSLVLAKKGCKLVIWDINTDAAQKVAQEIKKAGGEAWAYHCNVMDNEAVREVAAKVQSEVGKVDILINNAGIVSGKFITELSDEHITRTMGVNVLSHFWTIKAFLPAMISSNRGHIVTVASAAAISASTKMCDYVASKFAVYGLNESLRLDLARRGVKGVHTTCVCPYYINTGMFDGVKTNFLLPILEEDYVANRVVDAIQHNDQHLVMPWIVNLIYLLRLFPAPVMDFVSNALGVTKTMDEFQGRGWEATNPQTAKKEQ